VYEASRPLYDTGEIATFIKSTVYALGDFLISVCFWSLFIIFIVLYFCTLWLVYRFSNK